MSTVNHLLSSFQCWPLRSLFPELSESQFRVAALYAIGTSNQVSAGIVGISEGAVKSALIRSREALGVDDIASIRTLFNCRMLVGMYAAMADTPPKSNPAPS